MESISAPKAREFARVFRQKSQDEVQFAGGFEYPAVNAAIARFEKRLKIDRELQKKIKKAAKELILKFGPMYLPVLELPLPPCSAKGSLIIRATPIAL